MFAADCPTKRAASMTDMTLGRWSHVPAFSIPFLQSSFHREWQPAKPRTGMTIIWEFSNIFTLATALALAMIAP